MSNSDKREEAYCILRADYWQDVRNFCRWAGEAVDNGEIKDEEQLDEWLWCTLDGHQRVIYTYLAMETLLVSESADAHVEEYGEVPLLDKDAINWSVLAFSAFRRDVLEHSEWEAVQEALQPGGGDDNNEEAA